MIYSPGSSSTSTGTVAVKGAVITQVPPLELAATNLLLQSAAFNTTWTTSGAIVVTPDSTADPRGTVEADTLNDNGGTTGEVLQAVTIPNDALTRTFSVYLRAGTSVQTRVGVRLSGGAAKDAFLDVNPANGAAIASSLDVAVAGVEAVSIGGAAWIRVAVAVANNGSGNVTATPYIQPASLSAATQGTVIAWGAQFETGSNASSTTPAPSTQIPTTTAAVTRAAGKIPAWLLGIAGATYAIQIFTGNGTYTKSAGLIAARVRVMAGGGGGGNSPAGPGGPASGGGGGGYSERLLQASSIGATETITVGTGGGGAAAGASSSFGALLSATGGGAGGGPGVIGGAGGIGSGGSFNGTGSPGDSAVLSGTPAGSGGSSILGGGARGALTGEQNGTTGGIYGGGGSGAFGVGNATPGGTGGAGVVIVEEYLQL